MPRKTKLKKRGAPKRNRNAVGNAGNRTEARGKGRKSSVSDLAVLEAFTANGENYNAAAKALALNPGTVWRVIQRLRQSDRPPGISTESGHKISTGAGG